MQPHTTLQTQTAPETQEDTLCLRSVKTSALLTIFATLLLLVAHQSAWAWGFLIGALLSLLSLVSLTVIIPFLFRPNAPRHMSALLGMTLMMKLPLFMAGLYLMTHLRGVAPAAGVMGIVLGPLVIGLKTIGGMLMEGLRNARPALVDAPLEEAVTTPVHAAPTARPRLAELASD